jgi:hypothetical protein
MSEQTAHLLRAIIKEELQPLRTEMRQELASVRDELRQEFAGIRDEMRQDFAGVRDEMRQEFANVRQEFANVRQEFADGLAAVLATVQSFHDEDQDAQAGLSGRLRNQNERIAKLERLSHLRS